MADLSGVSRAWQHSSVLFFLLSSPAPASWPSSHSPPWHPCPCSLCSFLHLTHPCFPGRNTEKQPGLHGNMKTVGKKTAAKCSCPSFNIDSALALTEQIMGNNTPLCCRKMKCFSRRLSCWGIYLLLYLHWFLFISLHLFLFLLFHGRIFFLISFPLSPPIASLSFCFVYFFFHFPSPFPSISESLMRI